MEGRRCGARNKQGGGFCRQPPAGPSGRCRLHGGLSTGHKTREGAERTARSPVRLAAMQARFERLRAAKRAGLISALPGRPKGLKKMIQEARAVVAAAKAAPVGSELSEHGKRLQLLTGKSLDVLEGILDRKRPYKGDMAKHKALQKETAVSVLNAQMRVDENVLRVRQAEALGPVLEALLTAAGEPVGLQPVKAEEEK